MKDVSKTKPYDAWLGKLSPAAQLALTQAPADPADDESGCFGHWKAGLSSAARQQVVELTAPEEKPEDKAEHLLRHYALVECESGEFPVVRLFKTAEALAKHVGKQDGKDVAVAAFYGLFLRLSVGPVRYLMLPGGDEVITIPAKGHGPVKRIELDLIEFDCQDDGFLGPPELANTTIVADKLSKLKSGTPDSQEETGADEDES